MTHEELLAAAELFRRAVGGEEIQERYRGTYEWASPTGGIVQVGGHIEYRIKPKPREITLYEVDGKISRYATVTTPRDGNVCKAVRFREVIE